LSHLRLDSRGGGSRWFTFAQPHARLAAVLGGELHAGRLQRIAAAALAQTGLAHAHPAAAVA